MFIENYVVLIFINLKIKQIIYNFYFKFLLKIKQILKK